MNTAVLLSKMDKPLPLLKRLLLPRDIRQRLHSNPELKQLYLAQTSINNKHILKKPLNESRFIILDTETTGLHAYAGDEIISIAMLEYQGLEPTGRQYEHYINPQRPIAAESTSIHGIADGDVETAPPIKELLPEIMDFIDDAILVGHHIQFDFRFLNKTLKPYLGFQLKNPWLDTMLLFLAHQGRLGHYQLEEVASACNVSIQHRHSALGDAHAAAEIFSYLASHLSSPAEPVMNLINQQFNEIIAQP